MSEAINEKIRQLIESNKVFIFMKGSPERPMCGFSARAVEALKACQAEFGSVDVLQHPEIRAALPAYSQWPTFPQVFVSGELIGGCDIVLELFERGDLQRLVNEAS